MIQVTDCYKHPANPVSKPWLRRPRLRNSLLLGLGLALAFAATGCGSAQPPVVHGVAQLLRDGDLPGWKAVRAEPGLGELAPELSGLEVMDRVEAPALVRAGDAVRATALVFATPADAARALGRGREPGYRPFVELEFGGAVVGQGPGTGYRLRVTRSAEPGSDTVELYLVRGGRALALVELLSADGFDKADRGRVLDLVRSRLGLSTYRKKHGPPGHSVRRSQSLKRGRTNSSKVWRSQLATTDGVKALTEAVRGTSIASATSPK